MLKPMLWETFFEVDPVLLFSLAIVAQINLVCVQLMRAQNFLATRAVMEEKYPVKFYPPSYANLGVSFNLLNCKLMEIVRSLMSSSLSTSVTVNCFIVLLSFVVFHSSQPSYRPTSVESVREEAKEEV
jgi:hypothetical protein